MMRKGKRSILSLTLAITLMLFCMAPMAFAGEADIKLPDLSQVSFMAGSLSGMLILNLGLIVCAIGLVFGWMQYTQTK